MEIINNPSTGNHLPILMKIVGITDGPILELGMGMFSTPFLHWACFMERKLVSYDNNPQFLDYFKRYPCNFHEIKLAADWDKIDISGHWSVALVDHNPKWRRKEEIKRLANSTDYIIAHDSQGLRDRDYGYTQIYPLFKYRLDFTKTRPFTTVLSNFKDLSNLL